MDDKQKGTIPTGMQNGFPGGSGQPGSGKPMGSPPAGQGQGAPSGQQPQGGTN